MAWQSDGTGRDDKGQRDDATTNQTYKRTDERSNKAGATGGDNAARGEDVTRGDGAADDFFVCLVGGGRLCRSTFHVGIIDKPTYEYRLIVARPCRKITTYKKVYYQHTRKHVAEIGLSGQKLVTLLLVADMSPTLPAKAVRSDVIEGKSEGEHV